MIMIMESEFIKPPEGSTIYQSKSKHPTSPVAEQHYPDTPTHLKRQATGLERVYCQCFLHDVHKEMKIGENFDSLFTRRVGEGREGGLARSESSELPIIPRGPPPPQNIGPGRPALQPRPPPRRQSSAGRVSKPQPTTHAGPHTQDPPPSAQNYAKPARRSSKHTKAASTRTALQSQPHQASQQNAGSYHHQMDLDPPTYPHPESNNQQQPGPPSGYRQQPGTYQHDNRQTDAAPFSQQPATLPPILTPRFAHQPRGGGPQPGQQNLEPDMRINPVTGNWEYITRR